MTRSDCVPGKDSGYLRESGIESAIGPRKQFAFLSSRNRRVTEIGLV